MESSTIKQKTFSGIIWKLMERVLAQGVSLVVSIIIARILSPSDYSVVSLVAIFFTFANILITGGLNTALIQKKEADETDYSTVLIASALIAAVCYALLFCFAPLIAELYDQPLLVPIIRVMGITLIITAVKSVWCAYISSHLEFRKFFFATIGGTVFSAFVGIIMALKGFGAWSLVAQQMSNTLVDTVILMLSVRIRFLPVFSFSRFRSLFRYSWKILVPSFIGTAYTQVVPLFIGLRYNAADLSFYTKGSQLPETISSSVTNTLSAILFPVLAKVQDDREEVLRYTRLFMRLTSYVVFPMMLGFAAVADNLTAVILTEKWMPAVYYMRIFAFSGMFGMIHIGNCETIKAIGRSDVYLVIEIIKKVCYFSVIALFLFTTSSPEKLALAFIVNEIIAILVNSVPNIRLIGYRVRYQLLDLLPNLVSAFLMAVVVFLLGRLRIRRLFLLILQVAAGALLYLLISVVSRNPNLKYLIDILKEKLKKQNGEEAR